MKHAFLALACLTILPAALHAQAKPTATRSGVLQVGLGVTNGNTDYVKERISGVTAYATYDFTKHIGLEADIHYVDMKTPGDFGENTYEAGPRFVFRHGRFEPYAKVLFGIGTADYQAGSFANPHTAKYLMYSYGGGLDVRVGRFNIRAIDYELQTWPTFPPNNLTPSLITVGFAYRLR